MTVNLLFYYYFESSFLEIIVFFILRWKLHQEVFFKRKKYSKHYLITFDTFEKNTFFSNIQASKYI